MVAKRIRVSGVVQGVGFRPYVYNLAVECGLTGWIRNTSSNVEIHIEGESERIRRFLEIFPNQIPPLAKVNTLLVEETAVQQCSRFEILSSLPELGAFQPISPDIAPCDDCRRELFDPADRRYLYPFINCTQCGPRMTIIRDLPYDRRLTSMAEFPLCDDCRREYTDPSNRRFHAEPVACPKCGPKVWLAVNGKPQAGSNIETILLARKMLREGKILAIRGIGGFHLACDAANEEAVRALRIRKHRESKPFAVMIRDLALCETYCQIEETERALLTGREKPIVILRRKHTCPVAENIAPGNRTLGVMLPYTPLHEVLLRSGNPALEAEPCPPALVMTSGNLSEEPIAIGNEEAQERLKGIGDAFLLHNREVIQRCDDSVSRVFAGTDPQLLRRSRGYAPSAIPLREPAPTILAVGGELKNAFCLTRGEYAFLSPHIGDMENAETLDAFEEAVHRFEQLFHAEPSVIAHDLHPGYLTTRWAEKQPASIPRIGVQHHHAHVASCMAENNLPLREGVIALAFDGTGYGTDGAIWGGEVLIAEASRFERHLHMEYLPLPGGDASIRKPWRAAIGFAAALRVDLAGLPFYANIADRETEVIRSQVERRWNAPLVSSMGRLFDVAAVLAGIPCVRGRELQSIDYEAQAAIELEELSREVEPDGGRYSFRLERDLIRVGEMLAAMAEDARKGTSASCIGARFHKTIADLSVECCRSAEAASGIRKVCLTGGVWQNELLFRLTVPALQKAGFEVYTHRLVPTNDGGIALGQAVIAAERMKNNVSGNPG